MMETHPSYPDLSHTGPVNPVTARPASFEVWQAVVAPGDVFRHPREVLAHPGLSRAQKRVVLASWASDVHTLEHAPGLRCLTGCKAEPVSVDAVLAALAELDGADARGPSPYEPFKATSKRRRPLSNLRRYIQPGRRDRDDDDDPPPCPAAIQPRPRPSPSATALAVCA
ncbi:hypothetical protein [Methylobacterium trifolii]|uniref:Uncharacterized protein n=1 Tax=Methylobacterium trifolii TaxID=1003092 RepID=A0ABQ4TYI9_9HYPH|nr:hypothetical protein [Methylobacterium trifolii]GJE59107.1 hypothetical protein MPOCJGCO_1194 [Methylobacterium trifolii]